MVELGTGIALAYGGKELVGKLLGPTVEYIGERTASLVKRADQNLVEILNTAVRRLGQRIDTPGAVPAKVVRALLSEGAFCEDRLTAEYFGGVLASSRTENARDDRGAALTSLLGRLTTYQIRSHYLLYAAAKALFSSGERPHPGAPEWRLFITSTDFAAGMEFGTAEDPEVITGHSALGLQRELLLDGDVLFGDAMSPQLAHLHPPSSGIAFKPSLLGSELFLWGHGRGDLAPSRLFDDDTALEGAPELPAAPPASFLYIQERVESRSASARQQEALMRSYAEEAARAESATSASSLRDAIRRARRGS